MKTMTKTRTPQSKNDNDKKHLLFKKTNPKKNAYQILIAFSAAMYRRNHHLDHQTPRCFGDNYATSH